MALAAFAIAPAGQVNQLARCTYPSRALSFESKRGALGSPARGAGESLFAFAVLAAGCRHLQRHSWKRRDRQEREGRVVRLAAQNLPDGSAIQLAASLPALPDQPLEVLSALALAIICHEGGHFLCLRSIGLPAEEFAIGFGPEVINFGRKDGTEFVVRALPIGGYVRFQDEKTVKLEDGSMVTEFDARSAPERLWVLAGGVLANVAVAWSSLVLGVLNFGVPTRDPLPGIRIEAVDEAAFTRTGLKAKDVLLKIGSMDLNFVGADVRSTVDYISKLPQGRAVEMVVDRAGEQLQLNGTTVTDPSTGLQRLGVMIDANSVKIIAKATSFGDAAGVATDVFIRLVDDQFKSLQGVLTGVGSAEILGPVGIVQQGEELVQSEGLLGIFIFFVTINLNLAFINALPLPALDGGKALFVFAEQVLGRRLDEGKKQDIELAFVLLVLLGLASLTVKDVSRLFGR